MPVCHKLAVLSLHHHSWSDLKENINMTDVLAVPFAQSLKLVIDIV